MKKPLFCILFILVGAVAAPSSLQAVALQNRPWWEFYDDGLRAIDRSDWQAALDAFDVSIREQPRAQKRARTYGMRFIAYYPYYYRGLVHYQLGQLEEAQRYLQMSQTQGAATDDDRIRQELAFYLDATRIAIEERQARIAEAAEAERRRQLVETGTPVSERLPDPRTAAIDTTASAEPPRIVIISPRADAEPTQGPTIRIQGNAVDGIGIAKVDLEINGQPSEALMIGAGAGSMQVVAVPGPDGRPANLGRVIGFTAEIPLPQGRSRITVRVENVGGRVTTEVREVERKGG